MAAQRGVGLVLVVILAGMVVGSLLGELFGSMLPPGQLHDLLTRGPSVGLTKPATLDLSFIALTFGLAFKVNLAGVLGIVIAAFTLRKL